MSPTLARTLLSPIYSRDNLALLFQEVFTIITRLQAGRQRLGAVEVFRRQICNALKTVEQEGLERGYSVEDLRVATFAVVALLDECIAASSHQALATWVNTPLQLELSGITASGQVFFHNLERLLARENSACVADLLEVHETCLLLGFRGRYASGAGTSQIAEILRQLESRIERIRGNGASAPWRPSYPIAEALPTTARGRPQLSKFSILAKPKGANAALAADVHLYLAEARKRFREIKGAKHFGALPTVLLLGAGGSAKTSLLVNAGMEAELLTGQVAENSAAAPTRVLNLWLAWGALFLDPAAAVLADANARRKLLARFAPTRGRSLFRTREIPARSVVLAVNCAEFFRSGGAEALAADAQHFREVLSELSAQMHSRFPVYVVFTKADSIPYFADFVANLTDGEAAEGCGITLAEGQNTSDAFQILYHFFAAERRVCLARERTPSRLPGIYEFPREFAKIRPFLVHYLTDLFPNNGPAAGPFLRGFYFTGVRRVKSADTVMGQQWLFLKRLFSEVILADHRPSPFKFGDFSQA